MSDHSNFVAPTVRQFVKNLTDSFESRDTGRLQDLYLVEWNNLTNDLFKSTPWPAPDSVIPESSTLVFLYRELYYRHMFERCQPTVEDMFDSFGNYLHLFNTLIGMDSQNPDFDLPAVWLWDIIDNFVLQFSRFHTFRHQAQKQPAAQLQLLADHEHVWSAQTVTRYLHVLVKKGEIDLNLTPEEASEQKDGEQQHPFFRYLGQFSAVALLNCQALLGDYFSALDALKPFELYAKHNAWLDVPGAFATFSFYVGWSNFMLRRYTDAVRVVSSFLHKIGTDFGAVSLSPHAKLLEGKMYGLLRLVNAVVPQKLEDVLETGVQETVNEALEVFAAKQGLSELEVLTVVFSTLGPVFIDTTSPKFLRPSAEEAVSAEMAAAQAAVPAIVGVQGLVESMPQQLQRSIFLQELEERRFLEAAEACLRLCTSVPTAKLATFLRVSEEELLQQLLALKHKRFEKVRGLWLERSSNMTFSIDEGVVTVVEHAANRSDSARAIFARNIINLENLIHRINDIGSGR